MNQFEDQLKQALSRKEPPPGFAAKILAKTSRSWPSWQWAAVAGIAACLSAVGVYETYRYQQGQFAKEQVLLALRITADKTHVAQQKVDKLNQRSFLP